MLHKVDMTYLRLFFLCLLIHLQNMITHTVTSVHCETVTIKLNKLPKKLPRKGISWLTVDNNFKPTMVHEEQRRDRRVCCNFHPNIAFLKLNPCSSVRPRVIPTIIGKPLTRACGWAGCELLFCRWYIQILSTPPEFTKLFWKICEPI